MARACRAGVVAEPRYRTDAMREDDADDVTHRTGAAAVRTSDSARHGDGAVAGLALAAALAPAQALAQALALAGSAQAQHKLRLRRG